MPLFCIERKVPGASAEDIDAAGFRATACAFNYPGLRWRSSYWDKAGQRLICIYEAESAEQISDHSRRARIPCDAITEVQHIDPALFVDQNVPVGT
ncbi:MAG TPA: nickel-binding protein [Dehalococcoidia bacterium]|jgi:hypothetical protein